MYINVCVLVFKLALESLFARYNKNACNQVRTQNSVCFYRSGEIPQKIFQIFDNIFYTYLIARNF